MHLYFLYFYDASTPSGVRQFLVTERSLAKAKRALCRRYNKPNYPVIIDKVYGHIYQIGENGNIVEC